MNLLTPAEVAIQLNVSERFVKDELRRKNLRGIKTGAGWRLEESDVKTYKDAHANVRPVGKAS